MTCIALERGMAISYSVGFLMERLGLLLNLENDLEKIPTTV